MRVSTTFIELNRTRQITSTRERAEGFSNHGAGRMSYLLYFTVSIGIAKPMPAEAPEGE